MLPVAPVAPVASVAPVAPVVPVAPVASAISAPSVVPPAPSPPTITPPPGLIQAQASGYDSADLGGGYDTAAAMPYSKKRATHKRRTRVHKKKFINKTS
ncbi:unnamed protein product [Anisakis simplex]|uniref:DUF1713 domain-containing protein n=1 Tax=Anisakis simplex TaxID=6269 RepID=A0A0M3JHN4_ANISI|nr:unnamed protein product [Anisakis simplex]